MNYFFKKLVILMHLHFRLLHFKHLSIFKTKLN
jgi:hypothetical protein